MAAPAPNWIRYRLRRHNVGRLDMATGATSLSPNYLANRVNISPRANEDVSFVHSKDALDPQGRRSMSHKLKVAFYLCAGAMVGVGAAWIAVHFVH